MVKAPFLLKKDKENKSTIKKMQKEISKDLFRLGLSSA